MMRPFLFFLLYVGLLHPVSGQKKQLEHSDFAHWKTLGNTVISADGKWVSYNLTPGEGDETLIIHQTESGENFVFPRGSRASFTANNSHAAFLVKVPKLTLDSLRRKKVKSEDLPKDTLFLFQTATGNVTKIPKVKRFAVPEKWSGWIVYHKEIEKSEGKKKKESIQTGTQFVIQSTTDTFSFTMPFTKAFQAAEEVPGLVIHSTGDDENNLPGIYFYDGLTRKLRPVYRGKGEFDNLAIDRKAKQIAFVLDTGTVKTDPRPMSLYYSSLQMSDSAKVICKPNDGFLPQNYAVSVHEKLRFSRDGSKLFFGMAPPLPQKDTNLLEEEIVQVEVWGTEDPYIYPMQKVRLDQERKNAFTAVYLPSLGKKNILGTNDIPEIKTNITANSDVVIGYTEDPYLKKFTWEGGPIGKDLYAISTLTGKATLIEKEVRTTPQLSPAGKYIYWFDSPDSTWRAYETATGKKYDLSGKNKNLYFDELNDSPDFPSPYGIAGWTTNDDYVLLYDRYDCWKVDPKGGISPNNLTSGRKSGTTHRLIRVDADEIAIDEIKPFLFHFHKDGSHEEGYLWFNLHTGSKNIVQEGPFKYTQQVKKAAKAEKWLFTKEDFNTFPNLILSPDFKTTKVISNANPQQADYTWGSMELVQWTSLDGTLLHGLLAKPDNFDPTKKYPMIVNFYERSSDALYEHKLPVAGRSQINYTFYTSRGYLVFNPDIPYKIGYPGESALQAVVSGTTALIDKGFVDKNNIGIQGHSWGGYQIAYILTRTNLFKCAESGAPVVNMFSAYGGIRWESGMSRMFQYEHTQSRIGGTLWEKPMQFFENSPLFFLDRINTPVLILHNDADGAVPWYQGIEFYMGMRRLGKPAWMLNYNGEPHWPVKLENRKDFQIRMQQFFDHYLLDKPLPQWMAKGIPAIEKGINKGY
ncbi:MAG: prolyl oligopeptidase family serine peptidase [Saprospiraceae bacterium]